MSHTTTTVVVASSAIRSKDYSTTTTTSTMVCAALEGKTWCGYPRKRVMCCTLVTIALTAAAITTALVLLLRPPDDIETIEQTESDSPVTAGELTVLRTAVFPSSDTVVAGTLSLLEVSEDGSYYMAFNDFSVSDDCNELEVRLSDGATSTSASATTTAAASGVLAVPLSVDDASTTASFTEPLDADFDVELYGQVQYVGKRKGTRHRNKGAAPKYQKKKYIYRISNVEHQISTMILIILTVVSNIKYQISNFKYHTRYTIAGLRVRV